MQTLVGEALIEIRATWLGLSADVKTMFEELRTQILAGEGEIGAAIKAQMEAVQASAAQMGASMQTATAGVNAAVVGGAAAMETLASAAKAASAAEAELAGEAAALHTTLRGTIIDEERLAVVSAEVAAGQRSAAEAAAMMKAYSAELRVAEAARLIDETNLAAATEGGAAAMMTASQEARIYALTSAEVTAQLRVLELARAADASAAAAQAAATEASKVALADNTREVLTSATGLTALTEAIRVAAVIQTGLVKALASGALQLGETTLSEERATLVTETYNKALMERLVTQGKTADVAFATKAALNALTEAELAAALAAKGAAEGQSDLAARITIGTAATNDAARVARVLADDLAVERAAMAETYRETAAFTAKMEELRAISPQLAAAVDRLTLAHEGLSFEQALVQTRTTALGRALVSGAQSFQVETDSVLALTASLNTSIPRHERFWEALTIAAKQAQGLEGVLAALARRLGVTALTEEQAAAATNAYTAALEKQFITTGRATNITGAMRAALASLKVQADGTQVVIEKVGKSASKTAVDSRTMGESIENAAVKFNFATRTVRNFIFATSLVEAAVVAVTVKMAEQQQKLLNMTQQFGIAASEISGFEMLSLATGESVDTINTSLRMLEKNFAGVGDGSKLAQQAFALLGIQTTKTGAEVRDTTAIFKQVSDVIALMPDGEQKVAIGTALMGRSFNAMIPIMNEGSAGLDRMKKASAELGTQLTTMDLLTGHEVVTAWTDFKESIQGVGFAIERDMAPSVLHAITLTTQWIASNRELIASNISQVIIGVGKAFGMITGAISDNISMLKGLVGTILGAVAAYKLLTFQQGLAAAGAWASAMGQQASQVELLAAAAGRAGGPQGLGLLATMGGSTLSAALGLGGLAVAGFTIGINIWADSMWRAAEAARNLIAELDRLPGAQRTATATQRAFESAAAATEEQIKAAKVELEALTKKYGANSAAAQEVEEKVASLTNKWVRQQEMAKNAGEEVKKLGDTTSAVGLEALEASKQHQLLLTSFRQLQTGTVSEVEQMKKLEDVTHQSTDALLGMVKAGKFAPEVAQALATQLGVTADQIQRSLKLYKEGAHGLDDLGKGAKGAASQLDKFQAAQAAAISAALTQQVQQLAEGLKKIPRSQALAELPGVLHLTEVALDAAIQKVEEDYDAKLRSAKGTEQYNAALAAETQEKNKLIEAHDKEVQKLILSVTGLESAETATKSYTSAMQTLLQTQDSLNVSIIDDQIKAITSSWNTLDVVTRESQLPKVLSLLGQKYQEMGEKADAADQKLLESARLQVEAAQDTVALAAAQGQVGLELQALDALYEANIRLQKLSAQAAANHSLRSEDLAYKLRAEEKSARDAAAGIKDESQAMNLAAGMASDLAKALGDLITTGKFQNLGKQLFAQMLDQTLVPTVEGMLKRILEPALKLALDGAAGILKAGIGAIFNSAAAASAPTVASSLTTAIESAVGLSAGTLAAAAPYAALGAAVIGGSIMAFQSHSPALKGAVAGGLVAGVTTGVTVAAGMIGGSLAGAGAGAGALAGAQVGGPIGAIAGAVIGTLVAVFGAAGPSMASRIAALESKWILKSLQDQQIVDAINVGLNAIGLTMTRGLAQVMVSAPTNLGPEVRAAWEKLGTSSSYQFSEGFMKDMKETGKGLIHSTVADVLHAFYQDISDTTAAGIQQSALAAGAAIAHEQGILGDQAVAFATTWAISFIAMAHQTGKSADEILAALQKIGGAGGALYGALDVINAQISGMGETSDAFFKLLNQHLSQLAGKKIRIGNLDDAMTVLTALGFDGATALEYLTGVLAEAGIEVEKFGSDWTNVILAVAGDAGGTISKAGQLFKDLGGWATSAGEAIEKGVVDALQRVADTAAQLGYSAESIDAFSTALGMVDTSMISVDSLDTFRKMIDQMELGAGRVIPELEAQYDALAHTIRMTFSEDAARSITDAEEGLKTFASTSSAMADMLDQKVLNALSGVVEEATKLGVSSAEGIAMFGTALAEIDPSMLTGPMGEAINGMMQQMALAAHMSVPELIDAIDPPLPDALKKSLLAVNALAESFGKLSGQANIDFAHLIKDIQDFTGQFFTIGKDGKKELNALGQEMVSELTSGFDSMWQKASADGQIGVSEITDIFQQISGIPAELLHTDDVQGPLHDFMAQLAAGVDDPELRKALADLAAGGTITTDMLIQAYNDYLAYKQKIEDTGAPQPQPPPEAPPTPADQPQRGEPPPPVPNQVPDVPPELLQDYQEVAHQAGLIADNNQQAAVAADQLAKNMKVASTATTQVATSGTNMDTEIVKLSQSATEYAAAVVTGQKESTKLADVTATAAGSITAEYAKLYGVPDDGESLSALNDMLGRVLTETLNNTTGEILGATGTWKGSFDFARGAVNQLTQAIHDIPTDKTVTIHIQQEGSTEVKASHTGEKVPGPPGAETLRLVEAGELIVPAATAASLPPDMVSRLLSGTSFQAPAQWVARLNWSPVMTGAPAPTAVQAAPAARAADDGYVAVKVPASVVAEALYAPMMIKIERDQNAGRIKTGGGWKVHPLIRAKASLHG